MVLIPENQNQCSGVVVSFFTAVIKHPDKKQVKGKRVDFSQW